MNVPRALWIGGWLVVLVLLHFTLRPLLGGRVQVDFLIIALLVIAIRTRPALGAFCGFVLGMLTDSLSPETFGAGALAMTIIGFASSWLKAAFFTENLLLNGVFVLAGKWAYDIIYVLAQHKLRGADIARELLIWSPLAAIVTGIVGIAVLVVSNPPEGRSRR
jgi:rod shape-determining protein MreD